MNCPKAPAYSIGHAKRDFSVNDTPGPGAYIVKSYLVKDLKSPQGVTFAKSPRELKHPEQSPGPGDYNFVSSIGSGPKTVMVSRKVQRSVESLPGPGDYSPKVLEKTVKYSFRKESEPKIYNVYPGPGSYSPKDIKVKSPVAVIGKASRGLDPNSSIPGPGAYNTPSPNKSLQFSFTKASRDLTTIDTGPGPGDYSPRSSFNLSSSALIVPRRPATAEHKTPGPGAYISINFSQSSPKWTFTKQEKEGSFQVKPQKSRKKLLSKKKKTKNLFSESTVFTTVEAFQTPKKTKKRINSSDKVRFGPGPGDYSPNTINKKYPSAVFGTGKKTRIINNKNPGPADYELAKGINNKGFTFAKTKKFKIIKFSGPGPGQYEIPHTIGTGTL